VIKTHRVISEPSRKAVILEELFLQIFAFFSCFVRFQRPKPLWRYQKRGFGGKNMPFQRQKNEKKENGKCEKRQRQKLAARASERVAKNGAVIVGRRPVRRRPDRPRLPG
jgi:hypothetical protein